jgi:endonuclease YncB( thermonuclease family)
VIDGETLEIRGLRIKLFAVDAPAVDHVCEATDDNRWRCGPRAAGALDELLEEAIVTCVPRDRDGEGRLIAVCSVGATDLSLWLLRNGLALEGLSSSGKYRQAQDEARAARRGMWAVRQR